MLAWLDVEADVPNAVYLHLVDALVAWAALMGEYMFPIEPEAGVDADLLQVLEGVVAHRRPDRRPPRADRVVLHKVGGRVGLAMQALRAGRVTALRLPVPRSSGG